MDLIIFGTLIDIYARYCTKHKVLFSDNNGFDYFWNINKYNYMQGTAQSKNYNSIARIVEIISP